MLRATFGCLLMKPPRSRVIRFRKHTLARFDSLHKETEKIMYWAAYVGELTMC